MFGKNCEELCGKCFKDEQCDHINGTCMDGYNPGYYEITCTESMSICSQQAYFFTYFLCLLKLKCLPSISLPEKSKRNFDKHYTTLHLFSCLFCLFLLRRIPLIVTLAYIALC